MTHISRACSSSEYCPNDLSPFSYETFSHLCRTNYFLVVFQILSPEPEKYFDRFTLSVLPTCHSFPTNYPLEANSNGGWEEGKVRESFLDPERNLYVATFDWVKFSGGEDERIPLFALRPKLRKRKF